MVTITWQAWGWKRGTKNFAVLYVNGKLLLFQSAGQQIPGVEMKILKETGGGHFGTVDYEFVMPDGAGLIDIKTDYESKRVVLSNWEETIAHFLQSAPGVSEGEIRRFLAENFTNDAAYLDWVEAERIRIATTPPRHWEEGTFVTWSDSAFGQMYGEILRMEDDRTALVLGGRTNDRHNWRETFKIPSIDLAEYTGRIF